MRTNSDGSIKTTKNASTGWGAREKVDFNIEKGHVLPNNEDMEDPTGISTSTSPDKLPRGRVRGMKDSDFICRAEANELRRHLEDFVDPDNESHILWNVSTKMPTEEAHQIVEKALECWEVLKDDKNDN